MTSPSESSSDLQLVLTDLKKSLEGMCVFGHGSLPACVLTQQTPLSGNSHSAFGVYNNCVEKLLERPSPFVSQLFQVVPPPLNTNPLPKPTFQKDVDSFSAAIEKHERHQQEVFKGIKDGFEHDIRKEIELALR